MKIVSSAIPPAPRGSGAHSVPAVTNPSRQGFESRPRASGPSESHVDGTAGSGPGQADTEPYIDAEFVEILREAASAAKTIDPVDETVRRALDAYRTAGDLQFPPGAMIDLAA